MTPLTRREVVGGAAACAAVLASGSAEAVQRPRKVTDRVTLGKTGIKTSILGVGTGTVGWERQSNQTRLGQAKFTEMIRHAYDNGIRFFDSADMYGSGPFLKEALKGLPRDSYVIESKVIHRGANEVRDDIDRLRKELGVDYIDTLLIHVVTEPDWNTRYQAVKDVLEEARQKGAIRAHGCSCHTVEALETAAADPWVQVDLARFNPWGNKMDVKRGESEAGAPAVVKSILARMKAAGKGVVGMKILGEGTEMRDSNPDVRLARARESVKHALSSGVVDVMVIGFESVQQVSELLKQTQIALDEIHAAKA